MANDLTGVRDVPIEAIEHDDLGLDRYARALGEFVLTCEMPMAVGIQGDWGSGKTSLMSLIENSIGFNPRSVKRLANTLLLLRKVARLGADQSSGDTLDDPWKLKVLFALVCLEATYEPLRAEISTMRRNEDLESLTRLLLQPGEIAADEGTAALRQKVGWAAREVSLLGFLERFGQIIDRNGSGKLDDDELQELDDMLQLTSLTSVQGSSAESGGSGRRKWTEQTFFEDVSRSCDSDTVTGIRRLHAWAANSGGEVYWGKGAKTGSLNFKPRGWERSVFTMTAQGKLSMHLGRRGTPLAEQRRLDELRRRVATLGMEARGNERHPAYEAGEWVKHLEQLIRFFAEAVESNG